MAIQTTSLEETAQALVAPGKGILPPTRAAARSRSASTRSASSRPRRRGAPIARCCSRPRAPRSSSAASSCSTRRSARRPPTARRSRSARSAGHHPGHQGRQGHEAARAFADGETVTEGLDGLRERLAEYHELGARFAKWRAVITIGRRHPDASTASRPTRTRSRATRRCARRPGIVPIVEPEVLMDGDAHDRALRTRSPARRCTPCSPSCRDQRVELEGTLLKPNMVLSGYDGVRPARDDEVAERDAAVLLPHVPAAVPGHRVPLGRPVRRGRDRAAER